MGLVRQVARLLVKDLIVELRAKELIFAAVCFATLTLLIFAFAFLGGRKPPVHVSVCVFWVTAIFTGVVAVGRSFEREREGNTLRALLLLPIARQAIYVSKLIS